MSMTNGFAPQMSVQGPSSATPTSYGAPLIDFAKLLNPQQTQSNRTSAQQRQQNPNQANNQNPQANQTAAQPPQGGGLGTLLRSIFAPTPAQTVASQTTSPWGAAGIDGASNNPTQPGSLY